MNGTALELYRMMIFHSVREALIVGLYPKFKQDFDELAHQINTEAQGLELKEKKS